MSKRAFILISILLFLVFVSGIFLFTAIQLNKSGIEISARRIPESDLLKGNNSPPKISSVNQLSNNELINICSASSDELRRLPGIGESLAYAIIEYRESTGQFSSIEDIMLVPGIGPSRFKAISEYICVN